jgi:hypothetical protein
LKVLREAPQPRDLADTGNKSEASLAWELHNELHIRIKPRYVQANPNEKAPICGAFAKPSDGLEPSTPSL